MKGWIGVDLDGTLAHYDGWKGETNIGAPIPAMVGKVKYWLSKGFDVRIFTARIYPLPLLLPDFPMPVHEDHNSQRVFEVAKAVAEWSREHIGVVLPITCIKDYGMIELWDDRAVRVKRNEGCPCCPHHVNDEDHRLRNR